METLGYRRPQFSEDVAWLPCWVQHHVEQFDASKDEPLGSSELKFKDSALFQGSIFKGNDVILLSNEASGHNNRQLFLSGEDNLSSTFISSSRNLLQFHLHLSSNGFSQWKPSQFSASDASQTLSKPDRVLSMHNFETSSAVKENSGPKTGLNPGGLNILLESSKSEPLPNNPTNDNVSIKLCDEKFILTRLKDAEINDAVKLSIAASEALVIHEIDALAVADAIEVSLRLKKARLEWLDEAYNYSLEDNDENDSLSDLDDFEMSDAFEDVGLTYNTFDERVSPTVSYVKETPASNNLDICSLKADYENDFAREKPELDVVLAKDIPFVSLDDERLDNYLDDHISSITLTNMVAENDGSTTLKDSLGKDAEQVVGTIMEDMTSQLQINENISTSVLSSWDSSERMTKYAALERFESRWLGGWTAKEETNSSPQFKQNNTNGYLRAFTCETSFLSESVDIAPDESSYVQMPKYLSYGESQSSRAVAEENMDISLSQDVVRSSSLSLDDPLCSVVPCSVALENTNSIEVQHHNNVEIDLERDFGHGVDLEIGNSSAILGPEVLFHGVDGNFMQIVDKVNEGSFRKHVTSLKTYSTLLPNSVSISGGLLRCKPSCPSDFVSIKNVESVKASYKFKYIEDPFGKENETFCEPVENSNSIAKLAKKNASTSETARDECDLPVKSPKALPLNPRFRRRLQASKPSTVRGKIPKKSLRTEDATIFQQSEKPQNIRSAYKKSHDGDGPVRKRVRFAEAEAEIMPSTSGQASSRRIRSTIASSEKLNGSEKGSDYETCEASFFKSYSSIHKVCMLQGLQFLLTGLSKQKVEDAKGQIQRHGGIILSDIPSVSNVKNNKLSRPDNYQIPIILSSSKQQTAKFLYGCAVNAFILHVDWLTNSIQSRRLLPPEKYLILSNPHTVSIVKHIYNASSNFIFVRVGIMLHGKRSFCTNLAKILKHGGGQVFKTLHRLVQSFEKGNISVAAIVTEDENTTLRHLKQCASERHIPMMPASWIVKSLYSGKVLPFGG